MLNTLHSIDDCVDCKKTFVLPLSVRADQAMIGRYRKKIERFKGHSVLMWCTHGERSGTIERELEKVGVKVDTIIGGTNYLSDALGMN